MHALRRLRLRHGHRHWRAGVVAGGDATANPRRKLPPRLQAGFLSSLYSPTTPESGDKENLLDGDLGGRVAQDLIRSFHADFQIANEITIVEGKDSRYAMHNRRGNDARI